jgi:hypothetical protein
MRAATAFGALALLAACGATAGVPSVTVDVDGVEVICRAEEGNLDPAACGEWAEFIIPTTPDAARIVFTRHPRGGPCEVELFDADGHIIGDTANLPCRPLDPEGSGEVFEMGD